MQWAIGCYREGRIYDQYPDHKVSFAKYWKKAQTSEFCQQKPRNQNIKCR